VIGTRCHEVVIGRIGRHRKERSAPAHMTGEFSEDRRTLNNRHLNELDPLGLLATSNEAPSSRANVPHPVRVFPASN